MQLYVLAGGGYVANSYLLESNGHAILVDPSLSPEDVQRETDGRLPTIDTILLTHAHFDHLLFLTEWRQKTGAPVAVHEYEADALSDPYKTAFAQFLGRQDVFAPPEICLKDGSVLSFGTERATVLHTPGHTVGSICLLTDGHILTGDTVFTDGNYGRTDLWSGDETALFGSIARLVEYSDALSSQGLSCRMYPGHGASGDFYREMRCFIQ